MRSRGPTRFCSLPHDEVIWATASFRRSNRSLNTPVIIASGISNTKTSAPTPSNLRIVLWRRPKNGCDFGNGGGACNSSIFPCCLKKNHEVEEHFLFCFVRCPPRHPLCPTPPP